MSIHSTMQLLLKKIKVLLVIYLAVFAGITTSIADEWQPEVRKLRVNNYDLAYVERGKGPALVLIHGGLSDYRTWLPLMNELSETSRTIAVSLRHYYPEKWNGKGTDFSLQQHADDIAMFIKSLDLGKVDLLGHSRGALVSMLVASQHPDLVRNLVLADPPPLQAMLAKTPKARKLMEKRRAAMEKTVNFYQQGKPERGLEYFVNYTVGRDAWNKTNETRRATLRDNSWTQLSHLQDLEISFDCNNANRISSPVLMITGERSAPLYGYMLSALKPCFKRVENAFIADAGHMMYSANPTAFVFEVQEFIAPQ